MELGALNDTFDRITKKQKLSSSKAHEMIHRIGTEIETAQQKLQSIADDDFHNHEIEAVLAELQRATSEIQALAQLESLQKDLTSSLNKYAKVIDKHTHPEISKAYRSSATFDHRTVNQIIAGHLYRHGLFDLGDSFAHEAQDLAGSVTLKAPFLELYTILESMRAGNLGPALGWVQAHSSPGTTGLELKLHSLQFIEMLKKGDRFGALSYARAHLPPFAAQHLTEVQRLMACLLWADRLSGSPYAELLSPALWDAAADELAREFCRYLGQPRESPLAVTVTAGAQALPTLLKLAGVMAAGRRQEWETMRQLPVAVELGKELQFHSVFVCPVAREPAGEENPPMLMPCGHALCRQSMVKLSKGSSRPFKCPYCPAEATAAQCRQLHL